MIVDQQKGPRLPVSCCGGGHFPSFHFPARCAPHLLTPSFLFHSRGGEHSSRQFADDRGKHPLFFNNCSHSLKTPIPKKSIWINYSIKNRTFRCTSAMTHLNYSSLSVALSEIYNMATFECQL